MRWFRWRKDGKGGEEWSRVGERAMSAQRSGGHSYCGTEHHSRAVHDIPSWQRSTAACDTTEISIMEKTQSRKEWT